MASSSATPVAGPSLRSGNTGSMSSRPNSGHQSEQNLKTSSTRVSSPPKASDDDTTATPPRRAFNRSWRFWMILISLAVISLCCAAEATIIIVALPTIVASLGAGNAFLWVPNAYFLAAVAALPLYAQMSDIFGRRHLLLGAVGLFVLGSGLCGGATSVGMVVAARAVQGLGTAGIETLASTIISDLVPLKERSKYEGVVMIGGTVGASIGPFLGGVIINNLSWRWIFYLTSILGGAGLVLLCVFLKVKQRRGQTFMARLKRIDVGGNAIFIGSVVAVLVALTWGGPVYNWESWHVVLPLILGFVGFVAFAAFEWTPRLAPEPSFPRALVSNRTSSAALFMTFISSIMTMWGFYFLSIYFQGILAKSPVGSGVAILPLSATVIPFCIIGGVTMSQTGRYKLVHIVGWSLLIIALGLCSLLDRNSSKSAWVCFQIIFAAGLGGLESTMLPVIQAPLEERYVATATGMWSFARRFGSIWGVTIPSVIFNNEAGRYKDLVSDAGIVSRISDGQAYEMATKAFLDTITNDGIRDQLIEVFTQAVKTVWYVGLGFAAAGFLAVHVEKEVKLRQTVNLEFGLEDDRSTARASNDVVLEDLPIAASFATAEPGPADGRSS